MNKISKQTFQHERDLYNLTDTIVDTCIFEGPVDGESPLKECSNIAVVNSSISLRYALWHDTYLRLVSSTLTNKCRAPIWYCSNVLIESSKILGVKTVRECRNITINSSEIDSEEFCWRSDDIKVYNSKINAVYGFFESSNLYLESVYFTGKYSFQYISRMNIVCSTLDTKDAFWHSKNVTVRDSVIKGEYLGWYSENLTLINCKIIGTQPLCYCKGLRLINCDMTGCDLAFEYSDVEADISGKLVSIKNPISGRIVYEDCEEIILKDSKKPLNCKLIKR